MQLTTKLCAVTDSHIVRKFDDNVVAKDYRNRSKMKVVCVQWSSW